jgi:hypothetical protein
MSRPITPRQHGLLDYGLAAANILGPRALGVSPRARRLFRVFGLLQGGLNAVTVQPTAVEKVVPFALHGVLKKNSAPIYFGLPLLLGLHREGKARAWWLVVGAALVVVYRMTDWDATPPSRRALKKAAKAAAAKKAAKAAARKKTAKK